MTKDEAKVFLTEVINMPADRVPAGSRLIEEVQRTNGQNVRVKLPSKLGAVKLLAVLNKWVPRTGDDDESEPDPLAEFIRNMRNNPSSGGKIPDPEDTKLS